MKMKKFDLRILLSLIASTFFLSSLTHPVGAVVGNESLAQVHILFWIAFVVVSLFTGGYFLVMLFFFFRYRSSANRQASVWSIKRQNKYIMAWVLIVIALVATETLVEAPVTEYITEAPPAGEIAGTIHVLAHQFQFMVWLTAPNVSSMPAACGSFDASCQNVTIQAGKTYEVNITSIDVIHSFFFYEFGYKLDAVPGRHNVFYLHVDKEAIGNEPALGYQVICSEYCGASHYTMAQDAVNGGGAARILIV